MVQKEILHIKRMINDQLKMLLLHKPAAKMHAEISAGTVSSAALPIPTGILINAPIADSAANIAASVINEVSCFLTPLLFSHFLRF